MTRPVGVMVATEAMPGEALSGFAGRLEDLGYESLWLPETFGREPVACAGFLLARTERLQVATGIANVYARDAHAMAQTRQTLAELSGGRFMLGLGVSNAAVNTSRGHQWGSPVATMRAYLDAMDRAPVNGPVPAAAAPRYLAAHGPGLQRLGAERADGIITYLMPPEHTGLSRARIGADPALCAVCPVLAETDPEVARRKARKALRLYLNLDYYHREWGKLGYTAADFADGGSDRLIDMLVAWGDADALRARLAAYADAGASRVIVMPFDTARDDGGDSLSLLAPAA